MQRNKKLYRELEPPSQFCKNEELEKDTVPDEVERDLLDLGSSYY